MKKRFLVFLILGMFSGLAISGCSNTDNRAGEAIGNVEEQTEELSEVQIKGSAEEQIEQQPEESVAEQTEESSDDSAEKAAELSAEQIDAYEQMALYIQEGFRIYGIEDVYQAYFGPIEEEGEYFSCDILLEGEGELWSEFISYTVDEETAWYTFAGQDERIFSKDSLWTVDEDSSFAADLKENYMYKVQIAGKADLAGAIHYFSEGGPVERDGRKEIPFRESASGCGYYVYPMLYAYQDERLDIDIIIEYPWISLADDELEKTVNEALKKAFFYGYYSDDRLYPEKELYTSICRTYSITREDENYFSVRIYEYNDTRGANHPNEWEQGITIDLQTGESLRLEDVVGKEQSIQALLDSGAFESLLSWEGESTEDWIGRLHAEGDKLSDYDPYFYLLDDGIGLVTFSGRYYNCLEAKFDDLGIAGL